MRVPRLFTDSALAPGGHARLDTGAAHYLGRVLRLHSGDPVVLFNGDGHDYAGRIDGTGQARFTVRIEQRTPAVPESPLDLTLVQAIGRGERMDYSLQKSTELGVRRIQPLLSKRVEVRISREKEAKRMAHWRGVIIAACEQCGRAVLPELAPPCTLEAWLEQARDGTGLLLDPMADAALSAFRPEGAVQLVVGPEGGFEAAEMMALKAAAYRGVRLGPRVLRTETAGPAAIAVLQAMAGDLR